MPGLTQRFAADLRSVGEARRSARAALIEWGCGERADDVAQVVTELATNAVLHAGTPFSVTVVLDEGTVRVAVADGSPRHPQRRQGSPQATTGRGLLLVAELSTAWGVDADGAGKAVWCVLSGAAPRDRRDAAAPVARRPGAAPLGTRGNRGGSGPRPGRPSGRSPAVHAAMSPAA